MGKWIIVVQLVSFLVLFVSLVASNLPLDTQGDHVYTTPIAPVRVSSWIIQPNRRPAVMNLRPAGMVLMTFEPSSTDSPSELSLSTMAPSVLSSTTTTTPEAVTEEAVTEELSTEKFIMEEVPTNDILTEEVSTEEAISENVLMEEEEEGSIVNTLMEEVFTEEDIIEETLKEEEKEDSKENSLIEDISTEVGSTEEVTTQKFVIESDTTQDILIEEVSTEETVKEEVIEEVITEQVPAEEAITEEVSTEQFSAEETLTEEPLVEEPLTEEPLTEEPLTEEPLTEEPSTEEGNREEPSTEEGDTEQHSTEEGKTEEVVPEAVLATGDISTEEAATEEVSAEKAVIEEDFSTDASILSTETPITDNDIMAELDEIINKDPDIENDDRETELVSSYDEIFKNSIENSYAKIQAPDNDDIWKQISPYSDMERKMNRKLAQSRLVRSVKPQKESAEESEKNQVLGDGIVNEDSSSRQYNRRPYPIRPNYTPNRPYRPYFGPERNGYSDGNMLYRTYDYCYTLWCKLKKMARGIGF